MYVFLRKERTWGQCSECVPQRGCLYLTCSPPLTRSLGWPKILKILKINKADPRCIFYGLTESKNINKSFWECFSTLPKAFQKYKGNFKKYKGKMWKLVFYHFEPLNLFKTCLMALDCIPEVLTHLLTPILPYLYITNVRCQMRHLCQKLQKCHIWHICQTMYVIYT